jgi:hypothetical protein
MAKKQGVPLVTLLIILGAAVLLLSPTGQTFISGLLSGFKTTSTGATGPQDVNRKLAVSTIDTYSGAAGTGTVKFFASDGKTLLETITIASGVATTGDYYKSGTVLVLEYNDASNSLVRKKITVPQMLPADIEAVTNNPVTLKVFTNCAALTASCVSDSGNSITDASTSASFNITKEGTTGSISFTWYVPTDNTGYLDSYDEIDSLNWNAVVYAKLSGTNYEYVSLNGWDGQYTKGTAVWYYKVLAPTQVTKYKVGNTYVYSGTSSITFDVEAGSYSGDAATAALFMYIYTDPAYHNAKGSFGPDSFQIDNYSTTGFQIYFTD